MTVIPDNLESLQILAYPDPRLRQPAEPADPADPRLAKLAERMVRLMNEAEGVGLAATQVGVPVRMFVASPTREPGQEMVIVNPEVVGTEGWQESREGCLSVPDITLTLRRRNRILLRCQDLSGQTREIDATGHLARIFQHEGDHLDGKLIIDRAGLVGRLSIRDAVRRLEEDYQSAKAAK